MTTNPSAEGDTKASAEDAVGVSPRYRRAAKPRLWRSASIGAVSVVVAEPERALVLALISVGERAGVGPLAQTVYFVESFK
jgi:hypothetical protein